MEEDAGDLAETADVSGSDDDAVAAAAPANHDEDDGNRTKSNTFNLDVEEPELLYLPEDPTPAESNNTGSGEVIVESYAEEVVVPSQPMPDSNAGEDAFADSRSEVFVAAACPLSLQLVPTSSPGEYHIYSGLERIRTPQQLENVVEFVTAAQLLR